MVSGRSGSYQAVSCHPGYFKAERQLSLLPAGRIRPFADGRKKLEQPFADKARGSKAAIVTMAPKLWIRLAGHQRPVPLRLTAQQIRLAMKGGGSSGRNECHRYAQVSFVSVLPTGYFDSSQASIDGGQQAIGQAQDEPALRAVEDYRAAIL